MTKIVWELYGIKLAFQFRGENQLEIKRREYSFGEEEGYTTYIDHHPSKGKYRTLAVGALEDVRRRRNGKPGGGVFASDAATPIPSAKVTLAPLPPPRPPTYLGKKKRRTTITGDHTK